MSACRTCGAEVVWAIWEKTGKRAPFNLAPVEGGNVLLLPGEPPAARFVGAAAGLPLFVCHFATCPDAEEHRR